MSPTLEIVRLAPPHAEALAAFFSALVAAGSDHFFHPHPFDRANASAITYHQGDDLFFGALFDSCIIAYGMLRGWDEGYLIPSLGIAVHPAHHGRGVGRTMMYFLHSAAQFRGATQIRLTVHPANHGAIQLYRSLGYEFSLENSDRWVGKIGFHSPQ